MAARVQHPAAAVVHLAACAAASRGGVLLSMVVLQCWAVSSPFGCSKYHNMAVPAAWPQL
jgi:hypothetical protein